MINRRSALWILAASCLVPVGARSQTLLGTVTDPTGPGTYFGQSLCDFEDVTGDGVPDFLVGAPGANGADGTATNAGAIHVVSGADLTVVLSIHGQAGEGLGWAVAAGDVNADGALDVIGGGDWRYDGIAGTVRAFSGADIPGAIQDGGQPGLLHVFTGMACFGWALDCLPDVDGDGADEIVVGANDWYVWDGTGSPGYVYVYSGMSGALLWSASGGTDGDRFGETVAVLPQTAGGPPSVAVGAIYGIASDAVNSGYVRVFNGTDGSLLYQLDGDSGGAHYGHRVADAGDADGDGFSDLLVGAIYEGGTGAAYLYTSGSGGSAHCTWNGDSGTDQFGSAVAGLGDLNCDAGPEFLICANLVDGENGGNAGRADVFSAGDDCPKLTQGLDGDGGGDGFGCSCSGIGDVSGDTVQDFAVGANQWWSGSDGYVKVYSSDFEGSGQVSLTGISLSRTRYDRPVSVTLTGQCLSGWSNPRVVFTAEDGTSYDATNVLVEDATTVSCDTPVVAPDCGGQVDYDVQFVSDEVSSSSLPDCFTFTPATLSDPVWYIDSQVTLSFLQDPKDTLMWFVGLSEVSVPINGYDGKLCVWPWFFREGPIKVSQDTYLRTFRIPNNPNLIGLTVLIQGLAGPSLGSPKDAAWTNLARPMIQ